MYRMSNSLISLAPFLLSVVALLTQQFSVKKSDGVLVRL